MATFGNTNTGTSSYNLNNYVRGLASVVCPENGVAESISAYLTGGSGHVKCALYKASDNSLVGQTEEMTNPSSGWVTFNFLDPKPNLTAGTAYRILIWGDSSTIYARYSGTLENSGFYLQRTYGSWPNPITGFTTPQYYYCIYCTYTPSGGATYEIYADAVCQSFAMPAYEAAYNITKDAAVSSQGLTASETTFNVAEDAIAESLASALVEVVSGIIEIFQDAITTAHVTFNLESNFTINKDAIAQAAATPQIIGIYPISKDAIADASATPSLQQILGISKESLAFSVSTPLIQSKFGISPEATVKVLAEFTLIKPTEVKITKLFLILGDLAIQIQGG